MLQIDKINGVTQGRYFLVIEFNRIIMRHYRSFKFWDIKKDNETNISPFLCKFTEFDFIIIVVDSFNCC